MGLAEYWLFDPIRNDRVIYALSDDPERVYRPVSRDGQGRLISPVWPKFALNPELLWQAEVPRGMAIAAIVQDLLQETPPQP